ncbi:hypothetical protein N7495_002993 [Penicillium taxi]|uniref:uncharacterized protein n=1 Tax=Penicillium taxi TaxID=168475 RepID=UPI002545576E|nr:uncharacterized protein N7495_002993 [Penicillium taxi]KAJ5902465.1 hypothetical protein N7495_002993 [Penicillium taxi]
MCSLPGFRSKDDERVIREKRASLKSKTSPGSINVVPEVPQARPSFHLTAPSGWMNDPCGLGYDPISKLYHLSFQWNPYGNNWGNMSWGKATSTDLVSWIVSPIPILTPLTQYDCEGIFTGCLQPTGIHGQPGALTAFYTSVSNLPIHFTLPYTQGSESLSLAVSNDGGKLWERQDCNPILTGPPEHLNVTGWRDPYITTWDNQLFGFVSGGVFSQTPAVFIYTINPADIREWKYAGLLVNLGINFHPSRWSGDFGVNWELANFVTLTNDYGDSRNFIVMGVEGCVRSDFSTEGEARHRRDARAPRWMSVKAHEKGTVNDGSLATYSFAGLYDHGSLYAANSFWDPQTSQHIVYSWILEDDLPDEPRGRQGWSGVISLPRVVNLQTLRRVTKARSSRLESITSIDVVPSVSDTKLFTIHTLGMSPDARLSLLRTNTTKSQLLGLSLPELNTVEGVIPLNTARWELRAEFFVNRFCSKVGIEIAHSANFDQRTTLAWDTCSETFTIHRPELKDPEINHDYEVAPHTLFTSIDENGDEIEETLRVHAFFDTSVLEVFVNERTVITTRIYHPSDKCFGMRFFAESTDKGREEAAVLHQADVWDGIGHLHAKDLSESDLLSSETV